jgi:GNAT superfamily N-acetyltransferase
VQYIGAMFDLGVPRRVERVFEAKLPDPSEEWRIGAIVGPSASGKSTLARAAYPGGYWRDQTWPARQAIVDCFGRRDVKVVTSMLTAVGFSSPPAWIRPFSALSTGEQFRANLARALLTGGDLVVYDEFTSVVDRTVARVGSAAVAKSIRKAIIGCRFVAISCHYDMLPWLQPDWVFDTSDFTLSRRRLRRPKMRLEICRCLPAAWGLFKVHHYLSAEMCSRAARCFLAIHHGQPIAFASVMPCPGVSRVSRVSRIVVLPDWQGIGIGRAFCAGLGSLYAEQGRRLCLRTSHQMMIRCLAGDPSWQIAAVYPRGSPPARGELQGLHRVSRRAGVSFFWAGDSRSGNSGAGRT